MKFIEKMPLRRKLLVAMFFPFFGLALLGADGLLNRVGQWRAISAADAAAEFSMTVSEFMLKARAERGLSALYVSTQGAQGKQDLAAARRLVDDNIAMLETALSAAAKTSQDTEFVEQIGAAMAGLKEMIAFRGKVDRQVYGSNIVLERYTALFDLLSSIIQGQIVATTNSELAISLRAQYSIDQIQESLGLQRAILSEEFALDQAYSKVSSAEKIDPKRLRQLSTIIGRQKLHELSFFSHATEAAIRLFNINAQTPCAIAANAMLALPLNPNKAGDYGVDPQDWFSQSSCNIAGLSSVNEHQLGEIDAIVSNTRSSVQTAIGAYLIVFIAGGAVSLWLALTIVKAISAQTAKLVSAMQEFGAGDAGRRATVESSDDLGLLASEFNGLADTIEAESARKQEVAEREAQERAVLQVERGKARDFIEAVAKGDLTRTLSLSGGEELEGLGESLTAMADGLAGVTRQTRTASSEINSSSTQLEAAVSSLSSGASEQAASVNETTATLEEIKATSTQTLSKAQQFGDVAERTRREGEQGVEAVEEAIRGIEGIRERMDSIAQTILALSEQTQQIGDITTVVSNIAQQSKMLALNASIEAAKAGEAGQGFSVVAAEVRDLAEQSQQSTAQVQQILQDIRHATDRAVMATEEGAKGVDIGIDLTRRNSDAIKQLSDAIREASLASQQIVAAVRQEVAGIDQVNTAMNEINKITAQFVTSTQQSKEATEALAAVANRLQSSVSVYKL